MIKTSTEKTLAKKIVAEKTTGDRRPLHHGFFCPYNNHVRMVTVTNV